MALFYAWGGKGINIELCRILASHPNLSSRCQLLQTKRMIDKWSCWTTTAMLKIKLCYLGRVHLDNNRTKAGQLLDNRAKIGRMAPRVGGERVPLWFWQTWVTPNMSTATLQNTFLGRALHPKMSSQTERHQINALKIYKWVHLGKLVPFEQLGGHTFTLSLCVIQKSQCDRRGPSGSILVKISLNRSNYLFCASPAGRRKWSRNWASQPSPNWPETDEKTERPHLWPPLRGFGASAVAAAIVGTQKK